MHELENVVFVPSTATVFDFMRPDGTTFYGRKTLADIQATHPDAVVMDYMQAHRLHCEAFRSPVTEITRAHYWYALEVLPPCKWRGVGSHFETFHVSEAITANVVNWYCMTRSESDGERFYTLADYSSLRADELAERITQYRKENPQSVPVPSWRDAEGAGA